MKVGAQKQEFPAARGQRPRSLQKDEGKDSHWFRGNVKVYSQLIRNGTERLFIYRKRFIDSLTGMDDGAVIISAKGARNR